MNGWTILIIVSLVFLFILFLFSLYLYNFSIKRKQKPIELDNDEFIFKDLKENLEWFHHKNPREVSIKSSDGLNLNGYYLKNEKETNKTMIVVHGYTSKALDMAGFVRIFYEQYGFNIMVPDLRGHGNSEGHYIGFGWHDRLDIVSWIDYLVRENEEVEIGLFGISMGGATVCMASGEDLPPHVKFIISDCAFDSAWNILSYQLKQMYRLPKFPLMYLTNVICRLKAKYNLIEANAINSIKKTNLPILFIHGDVDDFVPTFMTHNLYDACSSEKTLLLIKGARHGECYGKGTVEYTEALNAFLEKYS